MSIISNTTVLSNFAIIGHLELLHQLYSKVYIPTEVYEEIQNGFEEGYHFYAGIEKLIYPFVEDGWLRLTSVFSEDELRFLGTLPRRLHAGESACLAIAQQRQWVVLTDDLIARREATKLQIRISGSIGCLVLAVERELCTLKQANVWLGEMIQNNYRSPVIDLSSLL